MIACLMLVFVFFFFKQKTAYEMRISDWSSDVCSSDLTGLIADERHLAHHPAILWRGRGDACGAARLAQPRAALDRLGVRHLRDEQQIGRASCRERVCQYV